MLSEKQTKFTVFDHLKKRKLTKKWSTYISTIHPLIMDKMEIERIIDQVNKLYNDNWAGIDVIQVFNEIDDRVANWKHPLYNNTIHQITRHILATELVVIKRLQGINYKLTAEQDWFPADQLMEIKWSGTIQEINKSKKELINQLNNKDDSDLDKPIIKDYSTVYDTIHGHIQHSYYHIGQIVVIKNLINRYIEL